MSTMDSRYVVGNEEVGLIESFRKKQEALDFASAWSRREGMDCEVWDRMQRREQNVVVGRFGAAPELLAAAKRLRDTLNALGKAYQQIPGSWDTGYLIALGTLDDAIEKAERQTP